VIIQVKVIVEGLDCTITKFSDVNVCIVDSCVRMVLNCGVKLQCTGEGIGKRQSL